MIKVLVEAERNSFILYRYNELSYHIEYERVLRERYPFAYGFIVNSSTPELDSLDCFIISKRNIRHGSFIECNPVDVFVLKENQENDIKIIAVPIDEENRWKQDMKNYIDEFLKLIFLEWPDIKIEIGELQGIVKAFEYIKERRCK